MATQPNARVTPQEYLAAERLASQKSEFLNGEIFAMSGATRYHGRITTALTTALAGSLRGTSCNVYSSDLRVAISANGLYTYPDIVVTCDPEQFLDQELDTLLNPLFIIEVLSESTQDYDRGRKFQSYRSLSSLREYWTVAQNSIHIEQWTREETWTLHEYQASSLEASKDVKITATAIAGNANTPVCIRLFDIYERVQEIV